MNTFERQLLIGVGNPLRRDDGVGPAVVRQLLVPEQRRAAVSVIEHHGEGLSLLDAWQGYPEVTVIDATRPAGRPGRRRRFDGRRPLPAELFHYSSHLFGVAEAAALARSLRRLPERLTLYGIEGEDFGYGEELTPSVRAAAAALARRISADLAAATPTPLAASDV